MGQRYGYRHLKWTLRITLQHPVFLFLTQGFLSFCETDAGIFFSSQTDYIIPFSVRTYNRSSERRINSCCSSTSISVVVSQSRPSALLLTWWTAPALISGSLSSYTWIQAYHHSKDFSPALLTLSPTLSIVMSSLDLTHQHLERL